MSSPGTFTARSGPNRFKGNRNESAMLVDFADMFSTVPSAEKTADHGANHAPDWRMQ
jgi:hypothetical protein